MGFCCLNQSTACLHSLNRSHFLESSNHQGWKTPLRSSSPTVSPTPLCLPNHVLKCHIYVFFERIQGWWLHHCPEQPVPMLCNCFSVEIFPNVSSKPPLMQLEVIASHSLARKLKFQNFSQLTRPCYSSHRASRQPTIVCAKSMSL